MIPEEHTYVAEQDVVQLEVAGREGMRLEVKILEERMLVVDSSTAVRGE
ncbi:MAG: hypothetical protein KIT69_21805 [Propionibacteriaceae bacterium]|nr:hypothetical protein [Propionibacteriaceae bacterium]